MKKVIALGRTLSKAEQMKISGGDDPGGSCSCECTGGAIGSWTYNNGAQPSNATLHNDIDIYCSTHTGTCSGCTYWVA